MLSEMMSYCNKILKHRIKHDEKYLDIGVSIRHTHELVSVVVEPRFSNDDEQEVIRIKYDVQNDFYYFYKKEKYSGRDLEHRVIVYDKKDFYAYFDELLEQMLKRMTLTKPVSTRAKEGQKKKERD